MKLKLTLSILLIAFIIAFVPNNSYAAKSSYSQAITANPIGLAFSVLNATYEQQLSPKNSFTVFGLYYTYTGWSGFGIGGSYRWYFDLFKTRQKPIEGFSFGPRAFLSSWSFDSKQSGLAYDGGIAISVGGEAMYKWIWDGFTVEGGVVLDFNVLTVEGRSLSPFGLQGSVGYAW